MNFIHELKSWFPDFHKRPPLQYMKLGPNRGTEHPLMIQFFTWDAMTQDKSWWRHVADEIPRLADMGFTQIWLPPPNKAAVKDGRGYDAYDLWDLGEFNQKGTIGTRWGTKEELLNACEIAKRHNMDIIIDAVLNHKIGADRTEVFPAVPVDENNRLKETGPVRDIEGWTAYDFPGRGEKYSSLRWNQEHFSGLDWDHKTRTKAIYRIIGSGHKGWSTHVDRELGNYDYLLGINIDHRHPAVQKDLLKWGPWILETTNAVGFRFDAIKHIDRQFLLKFMRATRSSTKADMFAVSELWSGDIKMCLRYIAAFKDQTSFFDVPLHYKFHEASKQGAAFDLRLIMDDTILKVKPGYAVTFVDNHDTVEGQMLESWVGSRFKIQAYALILLREEGYPCVFYGDLYPDGKCFDESIASKLKLLIQARKHFVYGSTRDYLQEKNCIGFVRMGDSKHHPCVVILSNAEGSGAVHSIRMNVGNDHTGSTFSSFMTDGERVEIDAEGWGLFTCSAGETQVWVKL
ncbi:glycoside hydrolase family 13 protein [Dendrothele bispora CBS 962.96]|uniref:Glycoside hydrolase family 13 protein n=1 Tax=Dendrothele bispora (strain CBS 962.96) TaxID=1314807 RepID=A0A4S8MW88_DENBC|nr:glycoside hydrolase family 13 protein [Dendrothele bispora CBS 962.96]